MIDPVDEDDATVGAAGLRPISEDRREVRDIVRHEDALVRCRELEQLKVGWPLELGLLVEGADIVTELAQWPTNAPPGDVRVEEQPHPSVV